MTKSTKLAEQLASAKIQTQIDLLRLKETVAEANVKYLKSQTSRFELARRYLEACKDEGIEPEFDFGFLGSVQPMMWGKSSDNPVETE